jgi:hypothetical protein
LFRRVALFHATDSAAPHLPGVRTLLTVRPVICPRAGQRLGPKRAGQVVRSCGVRRVYNRSQATDDLVALYGTAEKITVLLSGVGPFGR